jgi:inorganic triphosphatase YgiF
VSLEIELRFDVGADDLARLARIPQFANLEAGRPATRRLSAIYYDTPEFRFAKAGLTLRVRKSGRNYVQTVKSEATGPLGAERGEYASRLPTPAPDLRFVPDPDIREKLQAIAGSDSIAPVIETDIRRTTRALRTVAGDEIELALDRGEIRALTNGHAHIPVSELELELKRGSPAALYDVARLLAHEAPLVVNLESKSSRGMRAIEGGTSRARKAGRIELAPDATAEEAFRASLSHCLRHIARNMGAVVQAHDPEGVHQLRVGLRRLRVALSALGDPFGVGPFESLGSRAKALGVALAGTRELDVFATDLLAPVELAAKALDLSPLRLALEELRGESWKDAVALVRSEEFTGFLLDLASVIETRAWREEASPEQLSEFLRPARALAAAALDRQLKKTTKRAKHLSRFGIAERHRLRIALKKLRYTVEFFAPQFDARSVSAFLGPLGRLQDLFGALNDAATAEHILDRIAAHPGETEAPELAVASGFVLGWHQSRIPLTWEKAKKRWKRFAKTEPFWVR